jgi:hypothetical protein
MRISDCGFKSKTATVKRLNLFASLRLCVKYLDHSRQDAGGAKKRLDDFLSNPQSEIRTSAIVLLQAHIDELVSLALK